MLKELPWTGNIREIKGLQNQTKNQLNDTRIIQYNYLKYKWIKCFHQKTQIGWMDTKPRSLYMLSTTDPIHTLGHVKTESEGLEKGISWKWKSKEHRVVMLI